MKKAALTVVEPAVAKKNNSTISPRLTIHSRIVHREGDPSLSETWADFGR